LASHDFITLRKSAIAFTIFTRSLLFTGALPHGLLQFSRLRSLATDLNLGIQTYLNGTFTNNLVIDTSAVATDTIAPRRRSQLDRPSLLCTEMQLRPSASETIARPVSRTGLRVPKVCAEDRQAKKLSILTVALLQLVAEKRMQS
jgi:hypothetical protein